MLEDDLKQLTPIEQRKMKTIEVNILKVLNRYRTEEIKGKIQELDEILNSLKIKGTGLLELPIREFNDHEVCLNWLAQTEHAIKDLQENEFAARIFSSEVEGMKSSLHERLLKDQKRKKGEAVQILYKLASSPVGLMLCTGQKLNSYAATH